MADENSSTDILREALTQLLRSWMARRSSWGEDQIRATHDDARNHAAVAASHLGFCIDELERTMLQAREASAATPEPTPKSLRDNEGLLLCFDRDRVGQHGRTCIQSTPQQRVQWCDACSTRGGGF